MSIFDYLAIIILLVLGAGFFGFLFTPLAQEISKLYKRRLSVNSSWKIKKQNSTINKIDNLISRKELEQALREIRKNLSISSLQSLKEVAATREYHQNILTRIIIIAEELDSRPSNIAKLESLFIHWADLNQDLIKAKEAHENLTSRRVSAGKIIPTWGKNIFSNNYRGIEASIRSNHRELEQEINKLINSLLSSKASYYH